MQGQDKADREQKIYKNVICACEKILLNWEKIPWRIGMAKEKKFSLLPVKEKAEYVYTWLVEGKAKDIKVLDVKSAVTDMVVIVSASSARHAKSLADHIIMESKKEKFEILSTEGYQAGTWVLVDLNDIVVHIFQEETRELFQLENLWREAESVVLSERAKKV